MRNKKNVADRRIHHRIILLIRIVQRMLSCICSAFHQLVYICTAYCDRKKPYRRQYGETSAYVIRNYEALITFLCRQILKRSSCLICRRIVEPTAAMVL